MAPRYQPSADYRIQIPAGEAVTFDIEALDNLVKSQGILLEHWSAMKCPVGMIDPDDNRRPNDHTGHSCSNGMVYNKTGILQGTFTGNGLNLKTEGTGNLDSSTAQVILPRFYTNENGSNGDRIFPAPYDRLYYGDPNILVVNWESRQASPTGRDRLSFPAVSVERLMDSRGNVYSEGEDFSVATGDIVWTGQRQPGQDLETGKGVVYSIRYKYRPYWYISRLLHEVRVTSVANDITGERVTEMVNKLVSIQREYVYLNEESDASSIRRQVTPTESGS